MAEKHKPDMVWKKGMEKSDEGKKGGVGK